MKLLFKLTTIVIELNKCGLFSFCFTMRKSNYFMNYLLSSPTMIRNTI